MPKNNRFSPRIAKVGLRRGDKKLMLFLYDVTSSYLDGARNYFGEYGYNRDGTTCPHETVEGVSWVQNGESQ